MPTAPFLAFSISVLRSFEHQSKLLDSGLSSFVLLRVFFRKERSRMVETTAADGVKLLTRAARFADSCNKHTKKTRLDISIINKNTSQVR